MLFKTLFKSKTPPIPDTEGRIDSVGIIMDGNGRWAKRRGMPRLAGHAAGAARVEEVLTALREMGIHHVTLYAFSTENWKRPKEEVDGIMDLVYRYLREVVRERIVSDGHFAVRFAGDISILPDKLREECMEIEAMGENKEFICYVALNYGGRDEIVRAARKAVEGGEPLSNAKRIRVPPYRFIHDKKRREKSYGIRYSKRNLGQRQLYKAAFFNLCRYQSKKLL